MEINKCVSTFFREIRVLMLFTRLFREKIANVLCTLLPVCICCLRACLPDTLINHGDQVFRMNEIG